MKAWQSTCMTKQWSLFTSHPNCS